MDIALSNLSFGYPGLPLFSALNARLDGGLEGVLAIMGPSGCGKTTLLKLIGGLLEPQGGAIDLGGDQKVSFMFQENRLLPWLRVLDNAALPLGMDPPSRERALHFLSLVGLASKAQAFPHELSGGQARRVSLARTFACPSPLILMDEPFQSLDIPLRLDLIAAIRALLQEGESPFLILTSHEPREALALAGRVIILGQPPGGIIYDRELDLPLHERHLGSRALIDREMEMIEVLKRASTTEN